MPKSKKKRKVRKAKPRRRRRGSGRPKGSGAVSGKLLKFARTVTPKQLRKIAKLHRLIPKYDDLRQTEKALKRRLKAVMKKAKNLREKIRVLTLT
jgi:hypothetical protein